MGGGLGSACIAVIRCGAGRTRPSHVLMVKAMVTVDRRCSKNVASDQRWQKKFYRNRAIAESERKIGTVEVRTGIIVVICKIHNVSYQYIPFCR